MILHRRFVFAIAAATWLWTVPGIAEDQNNNSVKVGDQWTYSRKDEITGTRENMSEELTAFHRKQ